MERGLSQEQEQQHGQTEARKRTVTLIKVTTGLWKCSAPGAGFRLLCVSLSFSQPCFLLSDSGWVPRDELRQPKEGSVCAKHISCRSSAEEITNAEVQGLSSPIFSPDCHCASA